MGMDALIHVKRKTVMYVVINHPFVFLNVEI